jgi:hypothetical protein
VVIFPNNKAKHFRQGFALLLTLAVLNVVIVLALAALRYVDDARVHADEVAATVEADALFVDMKRLFEKIKSNNAFREVFYATPLSLSSKNGAFQAAVTCKPLMRSFNINWLALDGNRSVQRFSDETLRFLEKIMLYYNASQPERFVEDVLHLVAGTKYGEQREMSQNYGNISYFQFEDMLERYRLETEDDFALRVPWKELFVFEPIEKGRPIRKISAKYMQPLALALYFDIDPEVVLESWAPGIKTLDNFVVENGGLIVEPALFDNNTPMASRCTLEFVYKGKHYAYSFIEREGEVNQFVAE